MSTSDVSVFFDQGHPNQHHYYVRFTGSAASTSLAGLAVSDSFTSGAGKLDCCGPRPAAASIWKRARRRGARRSKCRSAAADATGVFTLALSYGGTDYTTDELPFGATATQVRDALVAAIDIPGATFTVTNPANDAYDVTFGGSLLGVDVPRLRITAGAFTDTPSGTFTVEHRRRDIRSDRLPGGRRGPGGGHSGGARAADRARATTT